VVDQKGAGVPRALVEVRAPGSTTAASAVTDLLGRFGFDLREGEYTLDASAPGLAPLRRRRLDVSAENPPVRITLEVASIKDQILVTATMTETTLPQVGSSATVIRADELEPRSSGSALEALRSVPGLAAVQSGPRGQVASLFVRGGESDYAKVLIDGVPMNEPGGSFNFANLSTAGIDRIEIVRGPQSALFGSDAMAGVVQVFTRRGSSEGLASKPFLSVEGGSRSSFRYEAGIEGKGERLDYLATFARMDTDNEAPNGSFNDETLSVNVGLKLSQGSSLRAIFRNDAGRAGVPGPWAFLPADAEEYYRRRGFAGGVVFTNYTARAWTQRLSYTINDFRQFSEDSVDSGVHTAAYQGRMSVFPAYDFVYQTLNESRRQKIEYQSEWSLPHAHLLTAGASYEREAGAVGDPRAAPPRPRRDNFGAFVQDQWFRKRVFAAAGVRLEHNESFGLSAAPRISLAWHARQGTAGGWFGLTKIKGNFGVGIKEPTLVESYSDSPFFRGNPALKAEKSVSWDAGVAQDFGNNKGVVEVTFFENRFRDQIGFATTDFTTFEGTFFNVAKSRARGIEAAFRQDLGLNLELGGNYTFLDGRILRNLAPLDPVYAEGRALLRRPRHSGRVDLTWRPGRWTFGAYATLVGSRLDSDFLGIGLDKNPGYGVVDLLLSLRLMSGMTLYATAGNLLDKTYMEVLGYPAPPFHFRIGISAGY
jgi:outer membrane cobalamin receptor